MKVLVFSYAFICCFGGVGGHDGFWARALFLVLFGVNYLIALKNDDVNESIIGFFGQLVEGLHPICKQITDIFFRFASHIICWTGYFMFDESAPWYIIVIFATAWALWGIATLMQMSKK